INSGSQDFVVPEKVARQVLLGDIVASSSCFPGAFDPFVFPDDYNFKETPAAIKALLDSGFKSANGKDKSLPIMDGGIFDNQGVYSILLANSKNKKTAGPKPKEEAATEQPAEVLEKDIDLVVIADSNPVNKDLFPAPLRKHENFYPKKPIPLIPKSYTE